MYLTRIELPPLARKTQELLSDLYAMHRMIMGGFKAYDTPGRVLFRLEPERRNENFVVLVQSPFEPDWNHLDRFVSIETKEWYPTLDVGTLYRFRLRANPVVTRDGKRYGLIGEKDQREWLLCKDIGFELEDFRTIDEGHATMKKGGRSIHYKSVRFEGVARIFDSSKALQTVEEGIGPAKGFGFGLLSLAKG